ncbi:PTS N-acetyl-D-glucosamine transporter, partial [Burkholderia sp. SIMBA_057]
VLKRGGGNVQVIIGPEADMIADEIRTTIASGSAVAAVSPAAAVSAKPAAAASAPAAATGNGPLDPDPLRWLAVFGG